MHKFGVQEVYHVAKRCSDRYENVTKYFEQKTKQSQNENLIDELLALQNLLQLRYFLNLVKLQNLTPLHQDGFLHTFEVLLIPLDPFQIELAVVLKPLLLLNEELIDDSVNLFVINFLSLFLVLLIAFEKLFHLLHELFF